MILETKMVGGVPDEIQEVFCMRKRLGEKGNLFEEKEKTPLKRLFKAEGLG